MTDDPIVQILREAAARGRQLRLARERSTQDEIRSVDGTTQTQSSNPVITTNAKSSEYTDNAARKS